MTKKFHSSMTTFHPIVADDFSTMDDNALAASVSTLAAHIHAATYRLLVLARWSGCRCSRKRWRRASSATPRLGP